MAAARPPGRPAAHINREQLEYFCEMNFTRAEIAGILGVSVRTVGTYLQQYSLKKENRWHEFNGKCNWLSCAVNDWLVSIHFCFHFCFFFFLSEKWQGLWFFNRRRARRVDRGDSWGKSNLGGEDDSWKSRVHGTQVTERRHPSKHEKSWSRRCRREERKSSPSTAVSGCWPQCPVAYRRKP